MASSTHCRAGRGVQRMLGGDADACGAGAVRGLGEVEQVRAFGVVELQGPGECVEHRWRHPAEEAAFQFGVVLDADPGQRGDLAAAQPRDAALPDVGQAGLLRGDLGPAREQELADLGAVVHLYDATSRHPGVGCTTGTRFNRQCRDTPKRGYLEGAPAARPPGALAEEDDYARDDDVRPR